MACTLSVSFEGTNVQHSLLNHILLVLLNIKSGIRQAATACRALFYTAKYEYEPLVDRLTVFQPLADKLLPCETPVSLQTSFPTVLNS